VYFGLDTVMENNRAFHWRDNAGGWTNYGAIMLDAANTMDFVTGGDRSDGAHAGWQARHRDDEPGVQAARGG